MYYRVKVSVMIVAKLLKPTQVPEQNCQKKSEPQPVIWGRSMVKLGQSWDRIVMMTILFSVFSTWGRLGLIHQDNCPPNKWIEYRIRNIFIHLNTRFSMKSSLDFSRKEGWRLSLSILLSSWTLYNKRLIFNL